PLGPIRLQREDHLLEIHARTSRASACAAPPWPGRRAYIETSSKTAPSLSMYSLPARPPAWTAKSPWPATAAPPGPRDRPAATPPAPPWPRPRAAAPPAAPAEPAGDSAARGWPPRPAAPPRGRLRRTAGTPAPPAQG